MSILHFQNQTNFNLTKEAEPGTTHDFISNNIYWDWDHPHCKPKQNRRSFFMTANTKHENSIGEDFCLYEILPTTSFSYSIEKLVVDGVDRSG